MPLAAKAELAEIQRPLREAVRRFVALIVDDSPTQRRILRMSLAKWNFDVVEAVSGAEALEVVRTQQVDFVISDWVMPGMSGPELCQAIRAQRTDRYVYFILLTSKSHKGEVAAGLDAGADDFLSKPMNPGVMHARLRAGERLLAMQDDLMQKNRRITSTLDRLIKAQERIDHDLRAAARFQQSLIPQQQATCGPFSIGRIYQPHMHVGGDLIGYFPISEGRIAAYAIDVSGHGVSSGLLTARLSNLFTEQNRDENIAFRPDGKGGHIMRDLPDIMGELNCRMQDDTDQYFTMVLADINASNGLVRFCQAGHPNPAIIRGDGSIGFVGAGGPPVGLLPEVEFETEVVHLAPGERLMLYSDGITECESPCGTMLDEEGLVRIMTASTAETESGVLEDILGAMTDFTCMDKFDDDVSALMLTMPAA